MKRRDFLKTMGIAGAGMMMPSLFLERFAGAALPAGINFVKPAVLPKLISIFLYGGPSELAGNLTNILDINAQSLNKYPDTLVTSGGALGAYVTARGFWGGGTSGAGGDDMETMVTAGDMTVYRTCNRVKDDNKSHGTSVTQNLVGNLDITKPGFATTLAAVLTANNAFSKPIDSLILPVVNFEGESVVFNLGDLDISEMLRPVSLDSNFQNPFSRYLYTSPALDATSDSAMDAKAMEKNAALGSAYQEIYDAFVKRASLSAFIEANFNETAVNANLPLDPNTNQAIVYPDTNFGNRLKAAVSLAISNPDTFFINLGSGGLGGWDDHSSTLNAYPQRMRELMAALKVAVQHLNLIRNDANRSTDIRTAAGATVIFVFGDFGRNANLNAAMGWDHGNNQNLYTLGGWGVPGRGLGKVVGTTSLTGSAAENRLFTTPATGSYQFEPLSVASTIYKYFGVQNPEVLTGESAIDETT
ncbi:MAG TPA: DUF1501 domain-containing protein [Nitrospirota bacterium]|nr:DUF1501 domain-containing protein [Nitrospirota bacterium]